MYCDNDPERQETTLKKGDSCIWYREDGTVQLTRGFTRLKRRDGDDKYCIVPRNFTDFFSLVELLGEASGFRTELVQDNARLVEYKFI